MSVLLHVSIVLLYVTRSTHFVSLVDRLGDLVEVDANLREVDIAQVLVDSVGGGGEQVLSLLLGAECRCGSGSRRRVGLCAFEERSIHFYVS